MSKPPAKPAAAKPAVAPPAAAPPGAPALAPPIWQQPRLIALAAVIVLAATLLAIARSVLAVATVFEILLTDGALVAVWLAAAWGWGAMLARWPRAQSNRPLAFATSCALGLGAIGMLQLFAGLAGLINRFSAIAILAPGLAFACVRIVRAVRPRPTSLDPEPRTANALWLLLVPSLAIAILGATVPAGLLWGDEPHGYDVLEYHLQVPREWFELGRIAPLTHNVFSYFPMNVEMHFLLAMQLRGGPWAAMFAAQLMHVAMIGLAVVATYGIARELSDSKMLATLAGVIVGAMPWSALLAPVAYVEGGLMLYGTLAIGWFLIACRSDSSRDSVRSSILAGALTGLACGAKLTAVPMLVIALPIAGLLMRRSIRVSPIFVLAAALTLSPWLIRNIAWTRNPVFPEATSIFGKAHWTDEQVQRWQRANHHAGADATRAGSAWTQFAGDARFGYALLPAALIAAAIARREPASRVLLALLVLMFGFWLIFTHLQSRFLVLTIPVMALLLACGSSAVHRIALAGVVAAVVVACTWATIPAKLLGLDATTRANTRAAGLFDLLGIDAIDRAKQPVLDALRDDQTLVLVGDAAAFAYQRPMSRLRYRTVFDVDASGGRSLIDAWSSPRATDDVLLVDPAELRRMSDSYSGIPRLPREYDRIEAFILSR